jgi:uncharacterized phage-associated protein
MAQVRDVASYVLAKRGSMSAMKLQKLCYYAQAWHLVWEDRPLFDAEVQAWANGPVIPELYREHRGQFTVASDDIHGNPAALDSSEAESVDEVLRFYGDMTAHQLSELTHRERPWAGAREAAGVGAMERSSVPISIAAMQEYYLGIYES